MLFDFETFRGHLDDGAHVTRPVPLPLSPKGSGVLDIRDSIRACIFVKSFILFLARRNCTLCRCLGGHAGDNDEDQAFVIFCRDPIVTEERADFFLAKNGFTALLNLKATTAIIPIRL